MSRENVEVVERGVAAFNRGDWDAALELLTDDVVWVPFLASLETPGSLYGKEAIRRAWEGQRETLGGESFGIDVLEVVNIGPGTILIVHRLRGRGVGSGLEVNIEYATLWTFRSGKAARIDAYADKAEALAAVGLSE